MMTPCTGFRSRAISNIDQDLVPDGLCITPFPSAYVYRTIPVYPGLHSREMSQEIGCVVLRPTCWGLARALDSNAHSGMIRDN